jgi:hypothetical protein
MIYDWYQIFNYDEFMALDLPSKEYEFVLQDIGLRTILVTKGVGVGVLYDEVFLLVDLNGYNPFSFDGYAVYKDSNNNVWLGVEVEE